MFSFPVEKATSCSGVDDENGARLMAIVNVRLASVVLDNFMNVVHGVLVPNAAENMTEPSILGLFGQNGSGKTALIRSLVILKALLTEQPLKDEMCEDLFVC